MLTENRHEILEHVGRYRVTTIDAAYALFYRDRSREAARKALYRLTEDGYLTRFEIRNRSFYQLTPKGCAAVGVPRNASQPFSSQALIERYAMLCFCALGSGQRQRITGDELRETFPELANEPAIDPALQHYYADYDGQVYRLGRVAVDNGSEVSSLVQRCQAITRDAQGNALGALVREGAFVITILTPHKTKGERLTTALEKASLPVLTRVEVVPEMRHL